MTFNKKYLELFGAVEIFFKRVLREPLNLRHVCITITLLLSSDNRLFALTAY